MDETPATHPATDQSAAPAPTDEPHPFIAAMRQELGNIANMPAHIWRQIEAAFERVAAKL